jgi:hypothetical protein
MGFPHLLIEQGQGLCVGLVEALAWKRVFK